MSPIVSRSGPGHPQAPPVRWRSSPRVHTSGSPVAASTAGRTLRRMDYAMVGLLVLGAVLVIMAALAADRRERERQRTRLQSVERKLEAVLDHLGIAYDRPDLSRVESLLTQGSDVAAVKAYRETTGASLVEAKQEIDRMRDRS